jgi:two-component system, sensor histidine kinase and response regulator
MTRPHLPDLSLESRLLAASAVLAVLVAAVFVALILAISTLRDTTDEEAKSKDVTASALELENLVLDVEAGLRGYVITGNERFLGPYHVSRDLLPKRMKTFGRLVEHDTEQRGRALALISAVDNYLNEHADPVLDFAQHESLAAGRSAVQTEGRRRIGKIKGLFQSFLAAEDVRTASRSRAATRQSTRAIAIGITGLAAAAAFVFLFGLYLSRSIVRPVRDAAAGATRFAEGDLSTRLEEAGPGEVGELTRAFNEMAGRLAAARTELEEQNAQLRESERLKTELVNTVSHELRTPLASVLGFTSILLTREFGSETRRHYLGIVDAQARRLSELIDDFLDVRRIEEGQFELAEELLDMASLLREEAELYGAQSSKHHVEVYVPEQPLRVRGDPARLRQVVGNLLSNAIKYSPDGGTVELAAEQNGDSVRVHVRDEGVGIPSNQQPRIFTKFFRGDMAASGIGGTGLGLAVSRDIVESHGGRIGFTSDVGKGTTFWVELPGANGGGGSQRGQAPDES